MGLNKGFARNATTDAIDARLMDAELFLRNPDGSVRTGILQTAAIGGNIVSGTGTMAVAIASADFVTSRSANDGAYRLSNVGVINVTLTGAPASNSRYDVVYVKQNDSTAGDTSNDPVFDKVTGTAAATPSVPAVPTGALAIATILVPASVTSTNANGVFITTIAQYTSVVGGTIQYRSLAAAVADRTNTGTGQLSRVGDTVYRNDGTALQYWHQPPISTGLSLAVTGFNLGSGGGTAFRVSIANGIVRIDFRMRFSGTGMSWGDIRYNLPIPAFDVWGITLGMSGSAGVNDSDGSTYFVGVGLIGDGTWRVWRTGADNGASAAWVSSQPFNPATGDSIVGFLTYPAAAAG